MNYFAHAVAFLDRPDFAVATGIPDWLSVVDRKCRLRSKHVEPFLDDPDPFTKAVAAGVHQHLLDDAQFHRSRAFTETSLQITVAARDFLGDERGLRAGFLGHLLTELLLDATLIADNPGRLDTYFEHLDAIDPEQVEYAVNRMAARPTERLAWMISRFREARILSNYLEDETLLERVNQVMTRVNLLPTLPDDFVTTFPAARRLVAQRKDGLLEGIPIPQ